MSSPRLAAATFAAAVLSLNCGGCGEATLTHHDDGGGAGQDGGGAAATGGGSSNGGGTSATGGGSAAGGGNANGGGASTGGGASSGGGTGGGGYCTPFGCTTGTGGGTSAAGGGAPGAGGGVSGTGGGMTGSCTAAPRVARFYGNGATALSSNWGYGPLAAQVTKCGVPVANAMVSWAITAGHGIVSENPNVGGSANITTVTDGSGIARAVFRHPGQMFNPSLSNEPGAVQVGVAGGNTVDFVVTTFNSCGGQGCSGFIAQPQHRLIEPQVRQLGNHHVGEIMPRAIEVLVGNPPAGFYQGQAVPNVGVRIVEQADINAFSIGAGCNVPEGTVLSDSMGTAWCDLKIGNVPGNYGLRVLVGEMHYWDFSITVVP